MLIAESGIVPRRLRDGKPFQRTLRGWTVNLLFGLRYVRDDFVVRADIGFGREGTGVYLAADHMPWADQFIKMPMC